MTTPIPPDLEVHGMTKRFGPLVALKDVNFRLRPGQFHALLGENARAGGPSRSLKKKKVSGTFVWNEPLEIEDRAGANFCGPHLVPSFTTG